MCGVKLLPHLNFAVKKDNTESGSFEPLETR